AGAEKEIEIAAQPFGSTQNESCTRIEPPAEILEHGLELRHDINQEKKQNKDGGSDQKQRITDRPVEALSEKLAPGPILDDGARSLAAASTDAEEPLADHFRFDRQVAEILDAPDDLLARRGIDFADDDLSCLGKRAIAELRAHRSISSSHAGRAS